MNHTSPTEEPLGIIDVGSNSIKLLVANRSPQDHKLRVLVSQTLTVRISRGISHNPPKLSEEAMDLGVDAITTLVTLARQHGAQRIDIVATSAVRDAVNREVFRDKILQHTGISLRILSGKQEAEAIGCGLLMDPRIRTSPSVQVIDLGGGSLEYLHFQMGTPVQIHSYQLGNVRLSEQATTAGMFPENPDFRNWVLEQVSQALEESPPCLLISSPHTPLYGAGGSLFSIQQFAFHTGQIPDSRLPADRLNQLFDQILPLSLEERANLPGIHAGRADILPVAIATLWALCKIGQQPDISLCPFNLRFGLAAEILQTSSVEETTVGDLQ